MKQYNNIAEMLIDKKSNVKAIFNLIDVEAQGSNEWEFTAPAWAILDTVKRFGNGFVVDICTKALNGMTMLSEKQRWCIAFGFQKMTDEQICAE